MKYGIPIQAGDPSEICQLAQAAEKNGWDGIFLPDGIAIGGFDGKPFPFYDPWVLLGAIAGKTTKIRIGTLIAAVSRRRPWKLAREICTVDLLSNGRMILGAGLGAAEDDGGFSKVGEQMELKVRAELLDECLAILNGLWTGNPFSFSGKHYKVDGMVMAPTPVQKPRVPIWVVGVWPKMKSMNRTVNWDGVIVQKYKTGLPDENDVRGIGDFVRSNRKSSDPFDIIVSGETSGKKKKAGLAQLRSFRDAGATWWIENIWAMNQKNFIRRLEEGPPTPD